MRMKHSAVTLVGGPDDIPTNKKMPRSKGKTTWACLGDKKKHTKNVCVSRADP